MVHRILAAMDGSPNGEAAAALAIDWGRRFGAELIGLGILDKPSITRPEPVSLGGTAYKRQRDEVRLGEAHRFLSVLLAQFQQRCEHARVRCTVVEDVGAPHEQIIAEAAACDLVVLGRETHFQFETQDKPDATLSKVLRESPRPVIVVPSHTAPGHGVLIAYGGGREVARTLQTFTLLGLASGEPVSVVAVDEDAGRAEARLEPAGRFLAAHGLAFTLDSVSSKLSPASVILEEARRRRPRLLVMGAHGHHPMRDLFFTSVTRAVLKEMPVPVMVGA